MDQFTFVDSESPQIWVGNVLFWGVLRQFFCHQHLKTSAVLSDLNSWLRPSGSWNQYKRPSLKKIEVNGKKNIRMPCKAIRISTFGESFVSVSVCVHACIFTCVHTGHHVKGSQRSQIFEKHGSNLILWIPTLCLVVSNELRRLYRYLLSAYLACLVQHWSPAFLAPGTSFVEGNFSTDQGGGARDDSSALHLSCPLFLLLLHCNI